MVALFQNKRYTEVTLGYVVKVFMCQCVLLKCKNSRDIIFVTTVILTFILYVYNGKHTHAHTYTHAYIHRYKHLT